MRPVTFEQACYEPERCQLEVDEGRRRGWDIEMMMNDTACKVRAVRQLYLEQIDLGPYRKYVDGIRYDDQHPEAPTMFAGVDFHPETLDVNQTHRRAVPVYRTGGTAQVSARIAHGHTPARSASEGPARTSLAGASG